MAAPGGKAKLLEPPTGGTLGSVTSLARPSMNSRYLRKRPFRTVQNRRAMCAKWPSMPVGNGAHLPQIFGTGPVPSMPVSALSA